MSKVYGTTELGRKMLRGGEGLSPDEKKVLQYIRDNKAVTDDALSVVGDRWTIRKLKDMQLIKELHP